MTIEKIPVRANHEAISKFKTDLDNTVALLNAINEHMPINGAGDIPTNPDEYIFQKCLEDPLTRQIHERTPLTLDHINVPSNLKVLSGLLRRWHSMVKDGLHLIHKNNDEFYTDQNEVEAYTGKWKTFAEGEALQRLELCQQYISMVEKITSDPLVKMRYFKNTLVSWGRPPDERSLFPEVNLVYVIAGRLTS